jgi:hypothetical protein
VNLYQDLPDGSTQHVQQPGRSTKLRAQRPLPIAQRQQHEDFTWQRSPYDVRAPQAPRPFHRDYEFAFTTPYWMLTYFTEVAPPAYAPFPASNGPRAELPPEGFVGPPAEPDPYVPDATPVVSEAALPALALALAMVGGFLLTRRRLRTPAR